ncbi:protein arginine kinase [Paenibacillus thalictri]|uniref:Protein-arginine kinase n=1 Tax=Paenibacillus thalictri TaxID=2527873 RepID=A0A4Q9DDE4_9BACL|nr:protein arginine kinase [Paenibacillus thalictri]TBL69158.1 protein arginine kinase [Paenibacillus thalictri]
MAETHFFENALSDWMKDDGPDSEIVVSSRIRIARNLNPSPFPMLATNQQSKEVLDQVSDVIQSEEFKAIDHFTMLTLNDLNELQKQVLVEKHLISPALANESRNGAVILSDNESVSIMVNEEDHLRIQCLMNGFQIREAWDLASQIDDQFEAKLDYSFDESRGYLTSCPTNVGTGIRASVMIHLPALVLTQQINRILSAITQVGLAVRGLYGEGSEALGNLFQISNQITLGQSEDEIIDNLYGVVRQIIEHERAARHKLYHEWKAKIVDRVSRSFGILSYAAIIDSKEAAQRLSDVRLGADLGIIQNVTPAAINELMVMTQPAFLQQYAGEKLTPEERDIRRAELIRHKFSQTEG